MAVAPSRDAYGRKGRASGWLRLLQRLAVALVALIVCAGITVPAWRSARVIAAAFDTATTPAPSDGATTERSAQPPSQELHRWRESGTARPKVVLKAVESDGDEDGDADDALCEASHGPAHSLRCVPVREKSDRVSRGELTVDTSRFTAGPRLPRGPPRVA